MLTRPHDIDGFGKDDSNPMAFRQDGSPANPAVRSFRVLGCYGSGLMPLGQLHFFGLGSSLHDAWDSSAQTQRHWRNLASFPLESCGEAYSGRFIYLVKYMYCGWKKNCDLLESDYNHCKGTPHFQRSHATWFLRFDSTFKMLAVCCCHATACEEHTLAGAI